MNGRAWMGAVVVGALAVGVSTYLARTRSDLAAAAAEAATPSRAVVINELFYNAPDDLDEYQWIELHNPGDAPIDISDWSLDEGKLFTFPAGTKVEPKGFLVVALDPAAHEKLYRAKALGPLKRRLKGGGERVTLTDGKKQIVDIVQYKDKSPWPIAADGYSSSLERICATAPADGPENWSASPLPIGRALPAGTPGKANVTAQPALPPAIKVLEAPERVRPDQPLRVVAEVTDPLEVGASLSYRVGNGQEVQAQMVKEGATHWVGTIPPQKAGQVVRYRIRAAGAHAVRHAPAENDLRPTFSAYVQGDVPPARIPQAFIIQGNNAFGRPPRGASAFVWVDPATRKTQLFDYVNVEPRRQGRGLKVFFHKDRLLGGTMSAVTLLFEGNEGFILAEAAAYDLYRRAGNQAALTEFVRLHVNGRPQGYHLMVERPTRAFLRRNRIDDAGNMYKLLWYNGDVVGKHAKKTNERSGHADIISIVDKLNKTRGEEQWKAIEHHFDVEQVATYFAVNMILSHWDGYFNNYYTYHDTKRGKWMMFPWDQDKTWGQYDGLPHGQRFTDMPLTFGMNGGRHVGGIWWREPGVFSGPLLAHPKFRPVFLRRTKEILDKVYTQEVYFPILDDMAERLKEDVALRAKMFGQDEKWALRQLEENVGLLKTHLVKRREFLLKELAKEMK